jgi:XTP/dITP diphosphohydrolase
VTRTFDRVLVATTNPGKLRELKQILEPVGIALLSLAELGTRIAEPEEDGPTFEANARLKSIAYGSASGMHCLAEDSGLEVDALRGAPGVHSARYAGTSGNREERDEQNNRKLLVELGATPAQERTGRYVCAICLTDAGGNIIAEARGTFEGRIGFEPRGRGGFGYDPLFEVPELGCTAAELSPEQKNERSHRGQAARALAGMLARARR